jgi:hypothetical protein
VTSVIAKLFQPSCFIIYGLTFSAIDCNESVVCFLIFFLNEVTERYINVFHINSYFKLNDLCLSWRLMSCLCYKYPMGHDYDVTGWSLP